MSRSRRKRHRDEQPGDDNASPGSKKTRKEATSKAIVHETSYYYRDGFRCVHPYYFTFTTHAKGRWLGKSVYEMFSKEFQSETPEYYEKAITSGRVTVNGQVVQLSTIISDNDLICHRVHRHEPPVTSLPIPILHEDSQLIVINKPSSIPVHPCGRYRHNTIVYILCKEHNWSNLYTIHRLDRLTSGVLILAKSLEITQQLEHQIRERQLKKKYLCRVMGEFSDTPVECSQPIIVVSHKVGLCRVDQKGKPSSTLFTRLSYNGKSSLLQCEPETGRMHQIRVHLQWLGFPIIGDPVYNHPAWGPKRGQAGKGTEDMDAVMSAIVQSNYSSGTVCEQSQAQSDCKLQGKCIDPTRDKVTISDHQDHTAGDKSSVHIDEDKDSTREHHITGDATYTAVDNSPVLVDQDNSPDHDKNPSRTAEDKRDKGSDHLQDHTAQDKSSADHTTVNKDSDYTIGDQDPNLAGQRDTDRIAENKDPFCTECSLCRADPTPQQLLMCLHAMSYTGPDWQFIAPPPSWVADDWVPP